MIVFHEGLPRSGKSYEAMVNQVLPAIKSGRKVYSNIKGMNHAKIAAVLEMDENQVQELLFQVEWEKTTEINTFVTNDSLVVIDEVQDFWPTRAAKRMANDVQQWFTQHGHLGLDIVCCGQDIRDVDPIIRRRVDQKIVFRKQDALGRASKYSWVNHKATASEKFEPISKGVGKYDEKYFGVYQSHRPETTNKETKHDDRSILWKTPGFKYGLPAAAIAAILAANFLFGFFTKPNALVNSPNAATQLPAPMDARYTTLMTRPPEPMTAPVLTPVPAPVPTSVPVMQDYFTNALKQGRPRLGGYVVNAYGRIGGYVEFLDDGYRVKDMLTFAQLLDLGFTVKPITDGVVLINDLTGEKTVITAWPIDPFGRVSDIQRREMSSMKAS
ncbi:zonular occludens toxin family protein [Chitinolyticbacter albus]|uniref:zonular occludens toxin family protein n=1 Tax=Chitinolyticbacter albus TaxID=2961951 RepID=UPI00210CEE11|nr:zonular occludens toxin domain-containing protein [Chitinolyticbacter albus]